MVSSKVVRIAAPVNIFMTAMKFPCLLSQQDPSVGSTLIAVIRGSSLPRAARLAYFPKQKSCV
jgi:hypothetical protein